MRLFLNDVDRMIWYSKTGPHCRFFISTKGYLGLGPPDCDPGDALCVLQNFSTPTVLRRRDAFHTHVGTAFVHGVMDGEEYPDEESDLEEFSCDELNHPLWPPPHGSGSEARFMYMEMNAEPSNYVFQPNNALC